MVNVSYKVEKMEVHFVILVEVILKNVDNKDLNLVLNILVVTGMDYFIND